MPPNFDSRKNPYIGSGLAFPISINVQGSLQLSSGITNLEESIRVILGTKLGERVYRPNFGSRLSEMLFEPINNSTLLSIRIHVKDALEIWEPRIDVINVITEPDPTQGLVNIEIIYQPKDTYDTRSMVFPFYLIPPQEALT
jgi:phage baseplate assembly protein W